MLGRKLLAMGDSPLAAYETEDLVTFTKRYAVDLAGDYDGRLTLRAGVTPWVAWAPNTPNVSPKIWEDNGLGFTQRFLAGAADPYLYHIAEGFGTMWATFTTILRKWTGGTIWADIYISGNTFDFMVWWSKQNRLMLARRLGSNDAVGEILAFDGAITPPPAVLSSITDRVGYMTVIVCDGDRHHKRRYGGNVENLPLHRFEHGNSDWTGDPDGHRPAHTGARVESGSECILRRDRQCVGSENLQGGFTRQRR